ncbi:hypothetical protein ILUMI_14657 [Ignelater luminosus]|uniref:Uncharacterized protein n=1 Tax=Ignelater luminosus TaxID=2038154 RepID=A0A8K0CTT7_IGNLU|nr:hypothetical protein ILUMI_14657 [Ignelater luminosus]
MLVFRHFQVPLEHILQKKIFKQPFIVAVGSAKEIVNVNDISNQEQSVQTENNSTLLCPNIRLKVGHYTKLSSIDDYCSGYVSKLYSLGLPDLTIQTIIESTEDLLNAFQQPNVNQQELIAAFSHFNSKHKRECYFKEHIVEPVEINIGIRYDQVWDKENLVYVQVPISRSFTYVPIIETLKFLLQNNFYRELLWTKDSNNGNSNLITEFAHGSIFKRNDMMLQLQLYFDEFESVNPLGSKTGGHKIASLLWLTVMTKVLGINSDLDVIVKDIRTLETEGVYDKITEKYIKGTLVALSHDNLGGN